VRQHKIKKYIIHILAIPAIGPEVLDLPMSRSAIIACTSRDNRYLNLFPEKQKCIVPFADVEDPNHPMAIRGAHARFIIRFLRNLPEEVTDLYVCCSKGGSRSPAVAAAILRMSGRKDDIVWKNPFYVPNKLVYQVICREFGLFAPDWYVERKVELNRQCYLTASKNGDAGGYERWQLLE